MPPIVPRWEWRSFAHAFPRADAAIGALTPVATEDSEELYLLAPGGDNVKVRDGLLDIKVLRETDADGLQRWEPVLKAAFPLDAAATLAAFTALLHGVQQVRDCHPERQRRIRFLDPVREDGSFAALRMTKLRGWRWQR